MMPRSIRIIDVPFYLELVDTSFEVNPLLDATETCNLISQYLCIMGITFEFDRKCAEWTFLESVVLRLWTKDGKLVVEMRDLDKAADRFMNCYKNMKTYLK